MRKHRHKVRIVEWIIDNESGIHRHFDTIEIGVDRVTVPADTVVPLEQMHIEIPVQKIGG